jgi:magnesium transporter
VPGTSPGTLTVDSKAPPPTIRVIAYGPESTMDEDKIDVGRAAELAGAHPVTWVNVDGLGDSAVLARIGEAFDLHDLALEDVVNVGQRPKVEEYEDHLFIVLGMPASRDTAHVEQVSLFLLRDTLITFQERPGDCLEPVRKRIHQGRARIRGAKSDYLAYAVIDAVIDSFFPLLEQYGERLLDLEGRLLAGKDVSATALHDISSDLLHLRRFIRPLRDLTSALAHVETNLVAEETRPFFRDCYDHALQLIDLVETYRDLASSLLELFRANEANRMNEVMKVLTIMATLFIPLTFVAGIYGMNFNPEASPWNMPELNWFLGYPAALGVMAATAVGMLLFFHRKGWIG